MATTVKKKDAVVPAVQNTAPAVIRPTMPQMPEFMKKDMGRGTENLGVGDYEMPRISLIQGISEELQTYDGLKAGDFFHTLLEQGLGSELVIVPLHISKRYVLWRPRPPVDMGGILARADDGVHWQPANATFNVKIDKKGTMVEWRTARTVAESGLADWGTFDPSDSSSQPAATKVIVIVVALPDIPEIGPAALLLQRSAIRPANKLNGKLKVTGASIYGLKFRMSSFIDTGPGGEFNNYRFASDGFVEDEQQYEQYRIIHDKFKESGVQVRDLETASDEAIPQESRTAAAQGEKRF